MTTSAPDPVVNLDNTSETTQSQYGDKGVITEPTSELNDSAVYRANFLATFTHDEEKKIMRKVDYRILVLFGLIYMIKQVRMGHPN